MKTALLSTTAVTPLISGSTPPPFTETGSPVLFTVAQSGSYVITAEGAQGGSAKSIANPLQAGGLGAEVVGTFQLVAGETIEIAVGQAGGNATQTTSGNNTNNYGGGGGGGGSWVGRVNGSTTTWLEVAGGGGGAYQSSIGGGVGRNASAVAAGSGMGGATDAVGVYAGGGGAGALSDGASPNYGVSGKPGLDPADGFKGGVGKSTAFGKAGSGGFGGGGSATTYTNEGAAGGGGGGYSGGNGGYASSGQDGGGGGTSFLGASAIDASETAGITTSNGNGLVTITLQSSITSCFASGTRIETDCGSIAVELLRVGDHVRLAREEAFAPVHWIGHRLINCACHPRPDAVMPVRVRSHAFGPGQPSRDLILSPDHAVFVDDVLIPIHHLLNGATIVRERRPSVTYWHVELEAHDVLLAEGLPCETYLDTGNRTAFANAGPVVSAHPQFDPVHAMSVWAARACAPLITGGVERDAAHDVLLANAAGLGHEATVDPALALLVDGELVRASLAGGVFRFEIPAGATTVRLLSRRFVPAEMASGVRDHRTLGAAITGLRIDNVDVPLASLDAADGWMITEADGRAAWRWTDGDTELRCPGARVVEVTTGPEGRYWRVPVEAPARRARAA